MLWHQIRNRSLWLVILVIVLLAFGLLFTLPLPNTRTSSTTQSATPASCPAAGQVFDVQQAFDAQQEAFVLAQSAEQYRAANPFGGNYGLGSYTICLNDGTLRRVQSMPFKGYRDYTLPVSQQHTTHSEQKTYGWLQVQLSRMSIDKSKIAAIYVVIFSQVIVCPPCQQDMVYWQRTLRQKARTNNLYLSVWEIEGGKGFVPTVYPAGTGTPIAITDLRQVPIRFVL